MFNALQSARSAFNRLIATPQMSRVRSIWQQLQPAARRVARTIPPVAAVEAASQFAPLVTTPVRKKVEAVRHDWPFYTAMAKRGIGRRVLPRLSGIPRYPSPQFPQATIGREKMPFDLFRTPTKTASAEVQPFLEYPTPSPKLAALKRQVVQTAGFRPAAQAYFKGVPIYSTPRGGAVAMMSGVNPAIGIGEKLPPGAEPSQAVLHELLHTAPRPSGRGYNPYLDFLRAYNRSQSLRGIIASYGGAQYSPLGAEFPTGYPGSEEAFATVGETLGRSAVYSPIVGKYYRGIFEPGLSEVKGREYFGPIPQLLKEQKYYEEQKKKKKKGK